MLGRGVSGVVMPVAHLQLGKLVFSTGMKLGMKFERTPLGFV